MNREFARAQIGRFAMMDRYPKTELLALSDLVDALLTAPPTSAAWLPDVLKQNPIPEGADPAEILAKAVVDAFLDGSTTDTRCPTAADIKSAICARLHDLRPDHECPLCNGEGFPYIPGKGSGPMCSCWARRPAPVYKRNDRVAREMESMVAAAAEKKRL